MNTYKIPVTWEVCGYVPINAETPEEALEIFKKTEDDLELPEPNYYVDGSFGLSCDNDKETIATMLLLNK